MEKIGKMGSAGETDGQTTKPAINSQKRVPRVKGVSCRVLCEQAWLAASLPYPVVSGNCDVGDIRV